MIKKVLLKPVTSFSDLFTSDQLWGQMIWAISDLYGEEAATEAVAKFKENPPFLISSVMLDDYLPKPLYVDSLPAKDPEIQKHNKKVKWLNYDEFKLLQKDCAAFSSKKLMLKSGLIKETNEIHVSINRETFTSLEEGGLYNARYLYSDNPICFYISYEALSEKWSRYLNEILKYWEMTGLGGDKNVGHGQFKVSLLDITPVEKEIFEYRDSDFFISLSESFGQDIVPVNYSIDVYSGITGRAIEGKYRKSPILRYKTGSLFLEGKGQIAENTGVHSSCSYGLCFPIYMSYKENE